MTISVNIKVPQNALRFTRPYYFLGFHYPKM